MMRVALNREEKKHMILRKASPLNHGQTEPKERIYINTCRNNNKTWQSEIGRGHRTKRILSRKRQKRERGM